MSEFDVLAEVAGELGLPADAVPPVTRESAGDLSVVRWGEAEPEVVFLHGGGQNARTWDLVALGLGRRLPGLRVETVDDSGHSVQSDQPVKLAALLRTFLTR